MGRNCWQARRRARLLGTLLSTSLVATGLLVAAAVQPAVAANIFSDSATYGPNAVITVTGQTDYVTNCPAGGTNDVFGISTARIYIVPEATAVGIVDGTVLTDVQPKAHVVVDDPTAGVLNEPIGFTQPAGHVGPGTYAIVVNECQDGIYHAGIDDIFLNSFTVAFPTGTGSLPKIDPVIASIKALAGSGSRDWTNVGLSLKAIFYLEGKLPTDQGDKLIAQIASQVSKLTGVDPRANIQTLVANEAKSDESIFLDPPDPKFTSVAPLQTSPPLLPSLNDPLDQAATALANQVNIDNGTSQALLNAMQRYEGAQQANDLQSALNQALALQGYASDLAAQLPKSSAALSALSTQIGALPAAFDTQSAQLGLIQQQVKANGLNADQTAELTALGFSPASVTQAIADFEAEPAGATRAQLQATIGQLIADDTQAATAYQTLATDATNGLPPIISTLTTAENNADATAANAQIGSSSPTPISVALPGPTAIPGGPFTGSVGTPIALDGSASTAAPGTSISSYGWDDDGTGTFTSAAGAKPSITLSRPFDGFLGLKVTGSNGLSSLAYTRLTVTSSAVQPAITAFSPASNPRMAPNGSQLFLVTATPVNASFQWSVDGTAVPLATGPSFIYDAPGVTGFHTVKVVVSGGDPNGGTDTSIWNVDVLAPPGALDHLDLSPSAANVTTGTPQAYTAEAWAATAGGDLGDVTAATSFSVQPNGSCTGATCLATATGVHTVTGTDGSTTGTASLTVTGGTVTRLVLKPATASIASGGTQAYTAEGFDAANNDLGDVTGATAFSVTPDGSCTGATCTATVAGLHTVTGTDGTASGTAFLTVTAGPLARLVLNPAIASIASGGTQGYTAEGFDAANNDLGDVTGATTLSITPDGSCTGAVCTATAAGVHSVTGKDGSVTGTASLTVTGGAVARLVLNPAFASIASGGTQGFTAEGFDAANNDLGDVTGATTFSVTPDGSCSAANCTATLTGAHTVTGTDGTVTGTAALGVNTAGPDPAGTLYVADFGSGRIDVFAAGSNGNVAPIRSIFGPLSGVSRPGDVTVDPAGHVYSSNYGTSSITEYAPGANGNVTPIRTIAGASTGLDNPDDLSLASDGTLYVGNYTGGNIVVFAPGASGNAVPERMITTLSGPNADTDGVGVDATGTLYANDSNNATVNAFAPGANGAATPARIITGPSTGVAFPDDVKVDFNGSLVVSDINGRVMTFAPAANGNATPTRVISGSHTGLPIGNTDDLAVDSSGNIYVTTFAGQTMVEFAPGANGDATPIATLAGAATTFSEPEGVAVATQPAPTLTTTPSSSTIGLGSSGQDTAMVTGTQPTGSMIFKLFGPNDPTCTAAPAFISPVVTVAGNGAYPSAAFTPGALGTYGWVALYSGDSQNAAASTACNDPAETVTVVKASPTLSTEATPATVAVGASGTDVAALTGGDGPGGMVTFKLYDNAQCSGTPISSSTGGVTGASATSAPYTATTPGTYYWVASYLGDTNNNAATAPCMAPNETVTVPPNPTLLTYTGPTSGDHSDTVTLAATLTTATTAQPNVFTGYADIRDANFPSPWVGGPGVVCVCSAEQAAAADPDESAVRIDNPTTAAITISDIKVTCGGGNILDLWGSPSIPAGETLILTGTSANGVDGSDSCAAPDTVTITYNGVATTFTDPAHGIPGGPTSADETIAWSPIGAIPGVGSVSTPIPGKTLNLTLGSHSCVTGPTDSHGVATCTVTITDTPGSLQAGGSFSGDSQRAAATASPVKFTVTPEETVATYTGATTGDFNDLVTLAGTLTDGETPPVPIAGQTLLLSAGTQSCSGITNSSGLATCALTLAQASGTVNAGAAFAADSDNLAATSPVVTFTITQEQDSLVYTGATSITSGTSVTLSGLLKEDSTAPIVGRTMTFTLGTGPGAQTCSGPTDGTGSASCSLTANQPSGPTSVGASFSGDTFYLPASASTAAIVGNSTTLTIGAAVTGDFNDSVTVSATLVVVGGNPLVNATVSLVLNAAEHCQATTNSLGQASCSLTPLEAAGSYPLTAAFAGDGQHSGSTASGRFVVTREQTAVTYSGPMVISQGAATTVSAVLTTDGVALANRPVNFTMGAGSSAQTCSARTTSTGVARCSIANVSQPPGAMSTCTSGSNDLSGSTGCTVLAVKARFAGDSFYAPSSAAPATVLATIGCTATITGNVSGTVIIAKGTTCITNATLGGAVVVNLGASVVVLNSVIQGAVVSIGAKAVTVCNSTIGGAVTVRDTSGFVLIGSGSDASVPCAGNTLLGSVVLEQSGPFGKAGGIELSGNSIGGVVEGSVIVSGNTAPRGGTPTENNATEIEANTINGSIDCTSNTPAPTNDGSPNKVNGASSGQCAGI